MAKTTIAELDIDVSDLIKSTAEVKKALDALKKQQAELQKAGETSSEQYVQNAADIKTLSGAYNQNVKALSDLTNATADQANRSELLSLALQQEATSIAEAREQNKLLTKLRNEANLTTDEGREELEALNAMLDKNNAFIKENADAYTQQKINIGNYKEAISGALGDLNLMNGGLSGFVGRAQEAGGVGILLRTSLASASAGMMGLVKASLAFIATPVGAVIAALVAAFALIRAAMSRSEESVNKLKVAFASVTGVFNLVMKALEPLGKFLIDGIVMGFELAGKAAEKSMSLISSALAAVGLDSAAESMDNFSNSIKEGVKEAQNLARAEQALEEAQRKARLTQLSYQKDAEKFRQIRDNENLTIQERIKANEDLGRVLQRQLKDELAIAQQALNVANLRIKAEGATKANLDAQAQALTEIADIQERVTGQESEQLTNRVALQKEAADKAKEIREKNIADAIAKSRQEIDLFIAQQGFKKKSIEDEYAFNKKLYDKELADATLRYKTGKISKTEFETEKLNLTSDFAKKNADIVIAAAEKEIDIIRNNAGLTTDIKLQAELDYQKTRLEQGVIDEQEYQQAIQTIQDDFARQRADKAEAERVAKMEADAIDLENLRASQQLTFEQDIEIQREQNAIRLQQELEAAEKSGADTGLIKAKYAKLDQDLDKAVQENKVILAGQTFGALAEIFGRQSKLGKAFAIYQSTIDTYQGITKALASSPPPFNYVQAAAVGAAGFRNVAQIAGAKFEDGGIIGINGKRHSQGGEPVYVGNQYVGEAEAGEGIGILRRNAFASFMDFNNSFGGGSSKAGFFQNGGIITQGVRPESPNLDILAEAIASIPPPVVAVEEIQSVGNQYVSVKSRADL